MKKISIVCIMLLLGCSCGSGNSSKKQQTTAASTMKPFVMKTDQEKRADSIITARREALERKAYMTANFGMSFKEVAALPEFKNWHKANTKTYMNYYDKLGSREYTVYLYFYNEKLYLAEITSRFHRSAKYFDSDIYPEVYYMKSIFTEQYGAPTKTNKMPTILDMRLGQTKWAYEWDLGNKQIRIGIDENSYTGSEYGMRTAVYYMPIFREKYNAESISTEQEKKAAAGKI